MKAFPYWLSLFLTFTFPLSAVSNTFIDYQNYNHGYCPECQCYPCKCEVHNPDGSNPCPCPAHGSNPHPCPENHGKQVNTCVPPDPCCPAPVCGGACGLSICVIGLGIAVLAAAGAIIVSSNNGSANGHN